jgi:hypothetical protein
MIQNIVKKTHVLESIWIPEFSTLWTTNCTLEVERLRPIWMDLSIFYYAHNSKKNTVKIRLQLLGESVAQKN